MDLWSESKHGTDSPGRRARPRARSCTLIAQMTAQRMEAALGEQEQKARALFDIGRVDLPNRVSWLETFVTARADVLWESTGLSGAGYAPTFSR
jgi:hypothetical protein